MTRICFLTLASTSLKLSSWVGTLASTTRAEIYSTSEEEFDIEYNVLEN